MQSFVPDTGPAHLKVKDRRQGESASGSRGSVLTGTDVRDLGVVGKVAGIG